MTDISPAIQKLLAYNQAFAMRGDFMKIHEWINAGCDMEKDILPALEQMMSRKKDINSVAYFSPAVFNRRDNRIALENAKRSNSIPVNSEAVKAKGLKWKLERQFGGYDGYLSEPEKKFLSKYEQQHGRIEI